MMPKCHIPAGTSLYKEHRRVVIEFDTEQQADAFINWIMWLDKNPGEELRLRTEQVVKQ